MRQCLKLCAAFLLGVIVTSLVAWSWTAKLRADLDWAVQRGIWAEGQLILYRQRYGPQ